MIFYHNNKMRNLGNIRAFAENHKLKSYYFKLNFKNKNIISLLFLLVIILTILVLLLYPKAPILGPSIGYKSTYVPLLDKGCIDYSHCSAPELKGRGPFTTNLNTNTPISAMMIAPGGKVLTGKVSMVKNQWFLSVPQGKILLVLSQGSNKYQVKIK